jgi:GWxTD domain-containing protein
MRFKNINPIIICSIVVMAFASSVLAGNLYISADYACYKYSNDVTQSYVEFYYSLLRNQYSFLPDSTGYHAIVNMFIQISSDSGVVTDSNSWKVGFHTKSLVEAKQANYLINDIITAQLAPGSYLLTLRLTDSLSNSSGESQMKLIVPVFSGSKLGISQVQFAFSLAEPDSSLFVKAGKKIIPNTRRVFSHDDNIAYIYAEVYNLDSTQANVALNMRIYDGNDNLYKEIPTSSKQVAGRLAVILNGFNIAAFKSGLYKLRLTAFSGGDSASSEKYFEITPGKLEWEIAREKETLADFPEAINMTNNTEAKRFRGEILYIATRDELKQYDELTIDGKNNFAKMFWKRRDADPTTQVNEFKIEHYRRLKYVNEAFSNFRDTNTEPNGWRTDLGRVYIVYGPPSDEENYQSSITELPWKRWNYDQVEGGASFIFIDEDGYGNYRLVHSTAKGEPKDYNWEARLSPTSTSQNMDNSSEKSPTEDRINGPR